VPIASLLVYPGFGFRVIRVLGGLNFSL